jgi:hypothetical protein
MTDGSSYPVKHPDQVILTPRAIYVGLGRQPVAQQVVVCALSHITRLGPLAKTPGKRKRPKA